MQRFAFFPVAVLLRDFCFVLALVGSDVLSCGVVESSLALRFSLCRSSSRRGGNEWESDFDPREPSFSSQRLLLFILHTLYC